MSMRFTVPWMPPLMITFEPSCKAFWKLRISFCFFCCGRIMNSHMMASMATMKMSMPVPPAPPRAACAANSSVVIFVWLIYGRFCELKNRLAIRRDCLMEPPVWCFYSCFSPVSSAGFPALGVSSFPAVRWCLGSGMGLSILPVDARCRAMASSMPLMYAPLFAVL